MRAFTGLAAAITTSIHASTVWKRTSSSRRVRAMWWKKPNSGGKVGLPAVFLLCSGRQRVCSAVEGVGQHCKLSLRAGGVLRIDGLIHARNDDGCVSRVFPRRVDGVLEPGP